MQTNLFDLHCRGDTVYVDIYGQIYSEAESNANELVQFALPRRHRICDRRSNIAEAESIYEGATGYVTEGQISQKPSAFMKAPPDM